MASSIANLGKAFDMVSPGIRPDAAKAVIQADRLGVTAGERRDRNFAP
jgi:hypothetical protein